MKKIFLTLLLLISTAEFIKAKNPTFYISTTSQCDDKLESKVDAQLILWEEDVANQLQQVYPCAEVNTQWEIYGALNIIKNAQLFGKDAQVEIEELGKKISTDYLISLKITAINNTAILSAFCMMSKLPSNKKNSALQTMSRAMVTLPYSNFDISVYKKITKELIDGLKKYEICTFAGPIKLDVTITKKEKETEGYPVYCNGGDGIYKKTRTIEKISDSDWDLNKSSKYLTGGKVKFSIREEEVIEEQNDCYKCKSGRQGGRSYYKKITKYAKVEGLSNESEQEGVKVADARVEITFLDNDTYTMRVKAASREGEGKEKIEENAEGTCDNIHYNPKSSKIKVDFPLNYIFGPFKGNSQDEVLSHKDKLKQVDPNTKEETIITYEFNFTRD